MLFSEIEIHNDGVLLKRQKADSIAGLAAPTYPCRSSLVRRFRSASRTAMFMNSKRRAITTMLTATKLGRTMLPRDTAKSYHMSGGAATSITSAIHLRNRMARGLPSQGAGGGG